MKILRNNQYFLPLKSDPIKQKKVIKQGYQSQHASPDLLAAKSKSQLQKIQNLTMTTTDFAQAKNINKSQNTFELERNELEKKIFDESNKENRPLNSSLQKKHDRVVKSNIKQVKLITKDIQTITQQIHYQLPSQRNNQFYSNNNYGISECNNKVQLANNNYKTSLPRKDKQQSIEGQKNQQKRQKQNNNQKYYNLNSQLQKFQQKMTEVTKQNKEKDKIQQKKNQEQQQQQENDSQEILTERINRISVENIYSQFFENKENNLKHSNVQGISVICCQNHPEKKAKYCTINERNKKFCCSKCAVQLIKLGIQMQELEINEQLNEQFGQDENLSKIEKHNQLTEFLQNIAQLDENAQNITNAINDRSIEISNFYSQQIKKFQQFFIVLNKFIQNEEDKYISDLQKQLELSELQFSKALSEIEHIRKELDNSRIDIKQNYENILNKMNFEAFYNTLNQYKDKMNNYQRTTELFSNKQLQLTKYTFFKTDLSNFNKELNQNISQMLSNIIVKQLNPVQFIKTQNQTKSNSLFISFTQNNYLESLICNQNSIDNHTIEQNCVINLDPFKLDYQTPKIFQKMKKPFNSYSLPDDKVKETLNLGIQKLESQKFLSLVERYDNQQQENQDNKIFDIQELNPVQESIEFQKHCLPKNNFTFSKADNILNNSKLLESLTGNQIKQSIENYKRLNLECGLVLDNAKPEDNNQVLRIVDIDSPHFQEGSKRLVF